MRTLELYEALVGELISSREFLEYGEERRRLSDPKALKARDPQVRLLSARDRCLSRLADLQAYPLAGFGVRLGAKILEKLVKEVPFLGEGLAAINFAEYQPMIYVLPKELPLLGSGTEK